MRTVYVLGAGASMGSKRLPGNFFTRRLRMPSGTMFFRDAFSMEKVGNHADRQMNVLGLTYPDTTDLLADLWGLPREYYKGPELWNSVNVEDLFSVVDVAVSSLPRGSQELRLMRHVRACLLDFIDLTIWVRSEGQYCAYLESLFSGLGKEDSVISFNWDTLADATLDRLESHQYENYLKLMREGTLPNSGGTLLKLHGSLNWLTCPNPVCKNHRRIELIMDASVPKGTRLSVRLRSGWEKRITCDLCGRRREVYIIPPTSRKIVDRGTPIHSVWMQAREQLLEAGKIVVIGYSLPRADVHAEWLFREVELDTRSESRRLMVEIVDPLTRDRNSDLMKRYRSVFHHSGITSTCPNLRTYVRRISRTQITAMTPS